MDKIEPIQFTQLIGERVLILFPQTAETKYSVVTLRGVEFQGLWIESQDVTNVLLRAIGLPTSPQTPLLFVPFHSILGVLASVDQTALDEKAFDV
jgi:hypothetical protein